MARRIVTVFGGSGFVGRHLVKRLVQRGYSVRVAVRDVEAANFLKPMADAGQIVPWPCNVTRPAEVTAALDGAQAAVNLVGILFEWGSQTFDSVHLEGARNVAEQAAALGINRFVHMSALGADKDSDADYARTKGLAEEAVRAALPEAVIVRPSVIFGPEDNFFNQFAAMSRISPVLPVMGAPMIPKISLGGESPIKIDFFGDGGPKFQPVYVGDVAEAIAVALDNPSARGTTFELGGPAVYSFKELMELVLAVTGRKCRLVPFPLLAAEFQALFLERLPKPLLTRDQVKLLQHDNVLSGNAPGLADLGIEAQTAEAIIPTYLVQYRDGSPIKRAG